MRGGTARTIVRGSHSKARPKAKAMNIEDDLTSMPRYENPSVLGRTEGLDPWPEAQLLATGRPKAFERHRKECPGLPDVNEKLGAPRLPRELKSAGRSPK